MREEITSSPHHSAIPPKGKSDHTSPIKSKSALVHHLRIGAGTHVFCKDEWEEKKKWGWSREMKKGGPLGYLPVFLQADFTWIHNGHWTHSNFLWTHPLDKRHGTFLSQSQNAAWKQSDLPHLDAGICPSRALTCYREPFTGCSIKVKMAFKGIGYTN